MPTKLNDMMVVQAYNYVVSIMLLLTTYNIISWIINMINTSAASIRRRAEGNGAPTNDDNDGSNNYFDILVYYSRIVIICTLKLRF